MKKPKPIHFIHVGGSCISRAACNWCLYLYPIEDPMANDSLKEYYSHGTFDVKKVTCKNCLKTERYKKALDKANHPLFYWKERLNG